LNASHPGATTSAETDLSAVASLCQPSAQSSASFSFDLELMPAP
jgi:hypothetical protein